jgi:hypothetical protein
MKEDSCATILTVRTELGTSPDVLTIKNCLNRPSDLACCLRIRNTSKPAVQNATSDLRIWPSVRRTCEEVK